MDNQEKLATQATQDEDKQKHNTMCVGHHYAQTNTNNVNKTCPLLQTTPLAQFMYHQLVSFCYACVYYESVH